MKMIGAALLVVALSGAARANGLGDAWNDAKSTTKAAAHEAKRNAHDTFKRDDKKKSDPKKPSK